MGISWTLLLAAIVAQPIPAAETADWPQWRGRYRDSTWHEKGLADQFPDQGLKPRWRQPTAEHIAGLDPATGKVRWQVPHTTTYDVTISDPIWHDDVLQGERALILNTPGDLLLAELSPAGYRLIRKVRVLPGGTWANPAYADMCMFARNDKEIVCALAPITILLFVKYWEYRRHEPRGSLCLAD